jgi:homoisocitrate dehydrogenase
MPYVCIIEGDGIGREVVPAAVRVLREVISGLEVIPAEAGWECFLRRGVSVPQETLEAVRGCRAALFGAVSSPSHRVEGYRSAVVTLRQELDLYANLRPVRSMPRISPAREVDLLIVRENTEGLYSGRERLEEGAAIAERVITRRASLRIGRRALELARQSQRRRLTIVHKANILPLTDGLFRDCIYEAASEMGITSGEMEIEELLVDTAAYQLISQPERFSLIVTTNLFGDILSDEAAHWCGGLGFAASLNLGEQAAIAEPVHGSAPDIAGKGIANPIAAILSGAMLARYALELEEEAEIIEKAVNKALASHLRIENQQLRAGIRTEEVTRTVLAQLK